MMPMGPEYSNIQNEVPKKSSNIQMRLRVHLFCMSHGPFVQQTATGQRQRQRQRQRQVHEFMMNARAIPMDMDAHSSETIKLRREIFTMQAGPQDSEQDLGAK